MSSGLVSVLLTVSFTCFVSLGAAQKPEWIRNSEMEEGSFGQTRSKRVAIHPDGSIFVLGQYYGENSINGQALNSPANTIDDAFLAKYSPTGDLIWLKQLFQSQEWYSNRVIDLKVDQAGDLVFSGSCLWPSSILGSAVGTGPFIAKIDKNGNLLWLNFQPTPGSVAEHDVSRRGNRIGFDADNNILWFTDQINEFAPSGALVVMKYNASGVKLAAFPVTSSQTFYRPYMNDFTVHTDGSFIISGSFPFTVAFPGGPSLNNNGSNTNPRQFFITKFAANGSFRWAVYSNQGANVISAHTVDDTGYVYAAVQISSGATLYTTQGAEQIPAQRSLMRITPNGELDWMKPLESANVGDIAFAPDGLLYATGLCYGGEFRYQSYVRSRTPGDNGAFILKINTAGNFYGAYFGEPEDNPATPWGAAVEGIQSVVDAQGNIYTIGGFWDRQVWGCVPAVNTEYTFFLIKHSPIESPIRVVTGPHKVCAGTEVLLSTDLVSNGVLYKWFTPDHADPGPGTTLKNSIAVIAKQEYHNQPVIVSITDACDEYFAIPYIFNIPSPPLAPQLTIGEPLVCPGTSALYSIGETSDEASYQWTLPDGITAPDITDAGGEFAFSEEFLEGEVRVLVTGFCGSAESAFRIGTFKTPAAPVLTGNQTICPGVIDLYRIVEPVAYAESYHWVLPPFIVFSPTQDRHGNTLHALVQQGFETGEIKVRAVGRCKDSEVSLPITITRSANPGNAGMITGPEELCTNGSKVSYSIPAIAYATRYTWTIPNLFNETGIVVTTEPTIELIANSAGTNEIRVYGSNDCLVDGGETSIAFTAYEPLPTPSLSLSACDRLITVSNATNFTWFMNDIELQGITDTALVLTDSGTYHIEVANYCGLKKSNLIRAYPVLTSKVLIPNVITPNGDGKNDFFVIDKSLSNSNVSIVNRWGKSIYASPSYPNTWNGEDVTSGTYYVTVLHPCLPKGYTGWLSVIK